MENKPKFRPNSKNKLMDQVREVMRFHHYAYRTESAYCQWIQRFINHYDGKQHPRTLGAKHEGRFLTHLAEKEKVAASTQKQAGSMSSHLKNVLLIPGPARKGCIMFLNRDCRRR